MELDHFVIESSLDLYIASSGSTSRHDASSQSETPVTSAAPPAADADSSLDLASDVLDVFDVLPASLVLTSDTCFKPIHADSEDCEERLPHAEYIDEQVLFLDLQDWTPISHSPSSPFACDDLDPMAALLAFNASCTSPCK